MSKYQSLTDRARSEAASDVLRARTAGAAEALEARVQLAREKGEPYIIIARERAEPLLLTLREILEPYALTARDQVFTWTTQGATTGRKFAAEKVKPHVETALGTAIETTRETVAPAVLAAVDKALTTSEPVRTEARIRSGGALAALRGQRPPRSRRLPMIMGLLLLGAAIGAAAGEIARRASARGIMVSPTPLRPPTVVIPDRLEDADAEATEDVTND